MNSSYFKTFITLIFALLTINVFSQTSNSKPKLNISVGYLYSKLEEPKSYDETVYYDYKTEAGNGYSIAASVDFSINNFAISLGSSFSSARNILIFGRPPNPDEGMWRHKEELKMNYLNFRIVLKYYPFNWLNFQSGFRLSFPLNHQIRTLEVETVKPDIPVPADYPLKVWEQYESLDVMDINLPLGVAFGLERGPFIAFNYYLRLVNMTEVEEGPYLFWGGHRRNTFELSVGWKFDFEKKE